MKVTVTKYLNVRVGKPSVNAPCYQYLAPGSELEVDGKFYKGDNYEGIDTWMKDEAGNYYWSGGVVDLVIPESHNKIQPEINLNMKQSFSWFKNLDIENIWNKYDEYGENVTIAVLDSGYDTSNNDLSPGVIGVKALNSPLKEQIIDLKSSLINDTYGHGTFCASIIGARNTGKYNIGIAPKSKLLIGKLSENSELDAYTGLDLIIDGIEWAINSGAEIISISFGKFAYQLPPEDNYLLKIQNRFSSIIQDKKVLIFSLSGNNPPSKILERENYPASLDGCISVGASNKKQLDKITSLSSRTVIHAQGVDVESYDLNSTIKIDSGTSMSTPIVAGVAALAVSYLNQKHKDWSPKDLIQKIYNSGDPLQNSINKKDINIVNLFKIL
jgi:subtilisin family serine protease